MHLSSHREISQCQSSVALYWDYQNAQLDPDIAKLMLKFAQLKGFLISKNVYYNSQCKNQSSAMDDMSSLGYQCLDVPCSLKNSADNQLIADCLEDIDRNISPDIFILVSGDGDFIKLVRNLQKLGKLIIIFAQRGKVKQKLKERADQFYFVDELPELVGKKAVESQIDYNEAIECLTEAIKTALREGKRTGLGYINNLMCRLFPKYQGFSSIHTPSGKKFKNFGEFVNAAVKSGNVRRQNEELFLIDLDRITA